VNVGMPAYHAILERWGEGVTAPDGLIDRRELRHRVFSDSEQLEELNAIVHPEVQRLRDQLIDDARRRGDRVVVCDIPLLFERRLAEQFDRIVLVDAPRPVRMDRLVRDRGLETTEAMKMIASQMPAELKRARADYLIDNTGTQQELEFRAREVWEALQRDAVPAAS
jgi:dephospho-CoA kinase